MEEAPTMAYSYQREIRVYRRAQGALSRSRDGQDAGEMAPITQIVVLLFDATVGTELSARCIAKSRTSSS